jgi:hypothetical protein
MAWRGKRDDRYEVRRGNTFTRPRSGPMRALPPPATREGATILAAPKFTLRRSFFFVSGIGPVPSRIDSIPVGCAASIPTIDSATIDATVAAMSHDRAVWPCASRAVYATCTDNRISLRREGNQYAEERRGGGGSGDYLTDHKVTPGVKGVPSRDDTVAGLILIDIDQPKAARPLFHAATLLIVK